VVEAVGTQESMLQAIRSTRPGGHVGYVGVAHGVELSGTELFYSHVHLHGGPAPVRRFLPELVELIWNRRIDPGRVFDWSCRWIGCRGLPGHGRASCHQDPVAAIDQWLGWEAGQVWGLGCECPRSGSCEDWSEVPV
jgi:hypothetical protein